MPSFEPEVSTVLPATSRIASEVVAPAPIKTWLLVVETRTPELLNHVQLISVEPEAPASIPHVKTPLVSVFIVQPGVLSEATRTPPFVTYSPPPAS